MKLLLAAIPLPILASIAPFELCLALLLLGVLLTALAGIFGAHLRRRRIERYVAQWFQNRHRRTYQTRA